MHTGLNSGTSCSAASLPVGWSRQRRHRSAGLRTESAKHSKDQAQESDSISSQAFGVTFAPAHTATNRRTTCTTRTDFISRTARLTVLRYSCWPHRQRFVQDPSCQSNRFAFEFCDCRLNFVCAIKTEDLSMLRCGASYDGQNSCLAHASSIPYVQSSY